MRIRGKTEPGVGMAMGICIETNGSVLSVAQLQALEEEYGEEAARIVLAVGMKATNADELARLTGMNAATAERFHKGQMRTLRYLALKAKHLGWFANYIDEFTDDEEYARLVREIERKSPGLGAADGHRPLPPLLQLQPPLHAQADEGLMMRAALLPVVGLAAGIVVLVLALGALLIWTPFPAGSTEPTMKSWKPGIPTPASQCLACSSSWRTRAANVARSVGFSGIAMRCRSRYSARLAS